ncbi:MAG: hypothetical protein AAFN11_09870 [Chloroflexota bacterium]
MASKRAEALKADRARQKRQKTLDSIEARLMRIEAALGIVEVEGVEGTIEFEGYPEDDLPVIFDTVALGSMKRDDLEDAAERLGILDDIEGTGADGNVLVDDLRDALRPHATDIVVKAE